MVIAGGCGMCWERDLAGIVSGTGAHDDDVAGRREGGRQAFPQGLGVIIISLLHRFTEPRPTTCSPAL